MLRIAAAALALAALAVPAAADPGGKSSHGKPQDSGHSSHSPENGAKSGPDMGAVIISAVERSLIRDYFQQHPGVHSGDSLPPGIRKKIARGKPMPPGIAKKMPGDLHGRLSPRPGYDYRMVGNDVLLVEVATGVIVDLLKDVLR